MKVTDVCIATISLARNTGEENLLLSALEQLATLQLPVYITDGGSSKSFLDFLETIPHFKIYEAKGLWAQAKTSIKAAETSNAKFIFYTEPDKLEFFAKHLKAILVEIDVNANTGVVIASRSIKGFNTFPAFQQMTETAINNCCREITGKDFDYCYGPFLFNSTLVPYLDNLDDNIGWGWRPFVFCLAHRLGLNVESFEGDFNCPQDQREDDATERIYRMKQLTQNINGIMKAATIDLPGENQ